MSTSEHKKFHEGQGVWTRFGQHNEWQYGTYLAYLPCQASFHHQVRFMPKGGVASFADNEIITEEEHAKLVLTS